MSEKLLEAISLGASDLRVSSLGVGTNSWGIGRRADPGQHSTFETALDLGINLFDTAEIYGGGGSERTLGQFLPSAGEKALVTTKFIPFPWRLRKSSLRQALLDSLSRLQVTRVDLYLIHVPLPPLRVETWMEALAEVWKAGLVRAVGVSNYNSAQVRRAHAALAKHGIPLACNQVEYSLLRRRVERNGLLEACRELNVALVAYRPIASGLLTGKYTPDHPPSGLRGRMYSRAELQRITPLIGQLREIAQGRGKTLSQVAMNWIIGKGALPIPGAKNASQVAENAGALGWRLEPGEMAALDQASDEIR